MYIHLAQTEANALDERLYVHSFGLYASRADSQPFIEHQHHIVQLSYPSLDLASHMPAVHQMDDLYPICLNESTVACTQVVANHDLI